MSKKAFFKRIAITAIAALGLGFLSVAPSQATVTAHTLTIDSATDAISTNETATAVLTHNFVNLGSAEDSAVVRAIVTSANASTAGTIRMTISDSFTNIATDDPEYGFGSADDADGAYAILKTSDYGTAIDSFTVTNNNPDRSIGTNVSLKLVKPTAAGTYVVSVYTQTSNAGAALAASSPAVTWTVTVTAPSVLATLASTSTLRAGEATDAGTFWNGTAEGTDSAVSTAKTSSSTDTNAEATVIVVQKNGTATNTARESLTVTVDGPAYISTDADARATSGKAITVAAAAAGTGTPIYVWSLGEAGTATISVRTVTSGLLLGTETVTFTGPVTGIAVDTAIKKVIRAGGFTASNAVYVMATDANAKGVEGLTMTWVSSDVAVVPNGTCAEDEAGGYYCSPATAVASTSGQSATLTIRVVDPADTTGATYLTTTYAVTLGGAVSTVTVTSDKASYSPGEAMVLTATAVDASGNTPYDGQSGPTFLVANKALGGTALSSVMNVYYDGKSTSQTRSALDVRVFRNDNTLFAPNAGGEFKISGVYGTDNSKSVSLTLSVTDDAATSAATAASDAALEAIDAANAATDAANLAAEAADAATVAAEEARDAADAATAAVEALASEVATLMAALKAQITTLAKTVAKIAKRVKA